MTEQQINADIDCHMKTKHGMEFDVEYGTGERRVRSYTGGGNRLLVEIWNKLWVVYTGRLCDDMFVDAEQKPITHFEGSGFPSNG